MTLRRLSNDVLLGGGSAEVGSVAQGEAGSEPWLVEIENLQTSEELLRFIAKQLYELHYILAMKFGGS